MAPLTEPLRVAVDDAAGLLGSREAAWRRVLAIVGFANGLDVEPPSDAAARVLAGWGEPGAAELLPTVYESSRPGRRASGTYYTPPALVAWLLDRTLADPGRDRVLDPACGCGAFLVPALRRLLDAGVAPQTAAARVHGTDLDPLAVGICRLLLRLELGLELGQESSRGSGRRDVALDVRVADGLGSHPAGPFDVVVGNPPFLGRLRRVAPDGDAVSRPGAYTDTSAVFLRHALGLVRPGGRVAMVQPVSLLGARDAAPVRAAVTASGALTDLWSTTEPVFADAAVRTCAPVVEVGDAQAAVRTWHGLPPRAGAELPLPDGEWGPLAAVDAGVPAVALRVGTGAHGVLGDLGACTADFREQYYGLVGHVQEAGLDTNLARLITSGLIDPAECRWGRATTRFAKRAWERPVVDVESLAAADPRLGEWARARLVPKVLVATQGRVIEAVVDQAGDWLPSVPVLTVAADPARLWHVLAVLLAPPVAAHAAARYLGTGLTAHAVKLSARQVAGLPLPVDVDAWDEGAALARRAQCGPDAGRDARLAEVAVTMTAAYGLEGPAAREVVDWWVQRAQRAQRAQRRRTSP